MKTLQLQQLPQPAGGNPGRVCGTFGKGEPGSLAVNFSRSVSAWCSDSCRMKYARDAAGQVLRDGDGQPRPGPCYSALFERHRSGLRDKLERHAGDPVETALRASLEILQLRPRWVRVSAFGSLPPAPSSIPRFAQAFRQLVECAAAGGASLHIQVESGAKRRAYQRIVGQLATVRQSCQTLRQWRTIDAPASVVGGAADQSRTDKLRECIKLAADRKSRTGRPCVVCPATTASWQKRGPVKCGTSRGSCNACSLPHVDVVFPNTAAGRADAAGGIKLPQA